MKTPLLIAALLLALTSLAAKPSKAPPSLPEGAIVDTGYVACQGEFITIQLYNLYGSDQWIEAKTFSIERDGKLVVILYFEYPHVDATVNVSRIILIREGEQPLEVTHDELVATYPNACLLLKPRA
jgi:hypothetical protein